MLWGLSDRFVDEVIQVYRSREQAERALAAVLVDEPEWEGMMEIVPLPLRTRRECRPGRRLVRRSGCRRV